MKNITNITNINDESIIELSLAFRLVDYVIFVALLILLLLFLDVVDLDAGRVGQQRLELLALLHLVEHQLELVDLQNVVGHEGPRLVQQVGFAWRREDGVDGDSELR